MHKYKNQKSKNCFLCFAHMISQWLHNSLFTSHVTPLNALMLLHTCTHTHTITPPWEMGGPSFNLSPVWFVPLPTEAHQSFWQSAFQTLLDNECIEQSREHSVIPAGSVSSERPPAPSAGLLFTPFMRPLLPWCLCGPVSKKGKVNN